MLLVLTTLAIAGDHKLEPSALPPAVISAVRARYADATIIGGEQEGKEYEANVVLGERHLDLAFMADGTWLEEEERVDVDAFDEAIDVDPVEQGVEIDTLQHGIEIDRSDDGIHVDALDHTVDADAVHDGIDVDTTHDGVEIGRAHV